MRFDNRWFLIAARTFFPKESVHVYRYKNVEFLEDHANGDANGARQVLATEMYRELIDGLDLPPNINLLDLGSNNGGFPLLIKSEGYNIRKMAAIEMNPHTYSRMRFNLERNFDCDMTLLNAAVCGSERTISITIGKGGAGDNIYSGTDGSDRSISIAGHTFDSIVSDAFGNERIDICKMDIEGAEFEVLPFSSSSLIVGCRYLIIEIHHEAERRREVVIEALRNKGFIEIDGQNKNDENLHYVHIFRNTSTDLT